MGGGLNGYETAIASIIARLVNPGSELSTGVTGIARKKYIDQAQFVLQ